MSKGPTLEDVCRLAAQHNLMIQFGVKPEDRLLRPYKITGQVVDMLNQDVKEAFSFHLTISPTMNEGIAMVLTKYVQKVLSKRSRIITLTPAIGQA